MMEEGTRLESLGICAGCGEAVLECACTKVAAYEYPPFPAGMTRADVLSCLAALRNMAVDLRKLSDPTFDSWSDTDLMLDYIAVHGIPPAEVTKLSPEITPEPGRGNYYTEVNREDFVEFVHSYPRVTDYDVTRISDPPIGSYNDFSDGKVWPDSVVAKEVMEYRGPKGEIDETTPGKYWRYFIRRIPQLVHLPSVERGCFNKTNLGRNYKPYVDELSARLAKAYGVYQCPHCGGTHLTTKLENQEKYPPLLYTVYP
jgi:hypothetical protein